MTIETKTHTGGLWATNGNAGWSDCCKDRGNVFDCQLRTGTHIPADQNEANAAFIVRACNSHAGLLAACRALLEIYTTHEKIHGSGATPVWINAEWWRGVMTDARAAIERAER